jgi:hypothetical protein
LNVDDSLKSLKERGYISANVKKFIKIDSLNYKIELTRNQKIKYIKLLNIDSLKVDIKSIITDSNDDIIDFNDLSEKIDSSIKYYQTHLCLIWVLESSKHNYVQNFRLCATVFPSLHGKT